ncbi:tRNA uridine(34) 5-carboxymethylaminomethyl modification radical SAM/GNAT enzyme Elp3 [Methanomicrobium antiquum]|uniref:tRNA carboxymethyluridine synthase n=1 Tax=Methanomicrobium antiquum TaxID=487686 RepID=A0AAF0FT61_9EURY|nr:tRNA uridine(34) 5-carboxymethylaminomethyl modification radical SAM/GNAT enzyme Elp3 [Methanomicrobium antiquum]WFN37666.1 tRNA uridine(34) 5-carboxymethylaminomethyl modification radical SAM/GNAT enzyme Elp3 [Methanomicrobium antiquum]
MLPVRVLKRLPLKTNPADYNTILREIISRILSEAKSSSDVQKIKASVAKKYSLNSFPRNSELFSAALDSEKEDLRNFVQVKPSRTISGVAPVAVMTSPHPCPHGICLPCPGGPENELFKSPQSYTGEEPAALRGKQLEYDPYAQVQARLSQFEMLGHHIEKAELIVMGGTMTARDPEYQEWFMRSCIRAMNEYGKEDRGDIFTFEELCTENEKSRVRCIAVTFETRPDWCKKEHIDRMLSLGVTKVELGVQSLDNSILEFNRRGHFVEDSVLANCSLRDAGIKVGFHVMPNLPSATIEDDKKMFDTLFSDERFCPDFIKIYPTLVTPGSEIESLWKRGEYKVYDEDELVSLVAYGKSKLPEYVRLQRVQRDIPAKLIVAGSHFSNFRQLAKNRLLENGGQCRCIRCREAGRNVITGEPVIEIVEYRCCGGTEYFIQAVADDCLVGFVRLRLPKNPWREELKNSALVRELHVYGALVPLSEKGSGNRWQHRNYGDRLLKIAEDISKEKGYGCVSVMSGIGVRPYYNKRGYERRGPYMVKEF